MLDVPQQYIRQQVQQALDEDIGSGDTTASLIPEEHTTQARVICRESAVLCGQRWFEHSFQLLDPAIQIHWQKQDGDMMHQGGSICTLSGRSRAILSGERTALNFLQTLSGTANAARIYVEAVKGTACKILDTRKTLPGLRLAQKYAVSCGGAENHRIGLYDAILIKENHIFASGSITQAVQSAQRGYPQLLIEVEVETLQQLQEAIEAGVTRVLLDNMTIDELKQAVAIARGKVETEASGGVDLSNIRDIAETGVNYISIGAMTKHLQATDFSLLIE